MINDKALFVNHLFPEEHDLLNSSREMYYKNERKCYKYHYTKLGAAKNILGGKNIRLYHYKHLSDTSEGRLLFDYILSQKKYSSVIGFLKEFYESALKNLFLSSFSIFGNRLSQWRGYGNVCIGFDFEKMKYNHRFIEDIRSKQLYTSGVTFERCRYIDNSNISEIDSLATELVDYFKDVSSNILSDISEFQRFSLSLGALLFSIKHIGFEEENEFRIFHYQWHANPFIENCKSYIELSFKPECVKRIVIGPSDNQHEVYNDLFTFLNNSGYNHVKLYKSTIPFISNSPNCFKKIRQKAINMFSQCAIKYKILANLEGQRRPIRLS